VNQIKSPLLLGKSQYSFEFLWGKIAAFWDNYLKIIGLMGIPMAYLENQDLWNLLQG